MRITDGHCHIASTRYIPEAFIEGVVDNILVKLEAYGARPQRSKLMDSIIGAYSDHDAEVLIRQNEGAGVSHAVVLAPDFTFCLKHPHSIEEIAGDHKRISDKFADKLSVFIGVDPRWGKDGLRLLERCFSEYKFSGYKLYPPCGYSPSDTILDPFYELCEAYKAPVLFHTGPTSSALSFEYSSPLFVDSAALRFPRVNFIIAHGSACHQADAKNLCAYRPNVYMDISAYMGTLSEMGWRNELKHLFLAGLNHKIIFGTDWPVFMMQANQRSLMGEFLAEDSPLAVVSDEDRELIMHGNITRLLRTR